MKNKIIFTISIVLLFCSFVIPNKVKATCNTYNASGSGIEQEAIDKCLTEQRRLDQQVRDQLSADAQSAQALYEIKLTYFYKLDAIEKQLETSVGSAISLTSEYRLKNSDCLESMRIPSDPTTLDPNVFLGLIDNKDRCVSYLLQYIAPKTNTTQIE